MLGHPCPDEMVHAHNISNGERFETYAWKEKIPGDLFERPRRERGGDLIIITTYATYEGGA